MLFEDITFSENAVYEQIIDDLLAQKYCVMDSFFEPAEVQMLQGSLSHLREEDMFKKAAIGNRTNEEIIKSIRGDFIHWINEQVKSPAEEMFFNKVNAMVDYLNRTCFLGILQKEFHYAVYPTGTFYKRHLDTFQNDDRRKLSIVCYLNNEDWTAEDGGQLTIYLPCGENETAIDILPKAGRMVIFESQELEHEVKPVNAPERWSITGWLKTR